MSETTGLSIVTKNRYVGIDVMRFIVVIPIIAAHMLSRTQMDVNIVGLVDNCARFVVPFFFLTSGFFLGRKDPETVPAIAWVASRLLPVFLFWMTVYLFALGLFGALRSPFFIMQCLYYGGPAFHLWFLPSLGMSIAGVLATRRLGMKKMLMVGIALYTVTLITYPYAKMIGIEKPSVSTLTGPFPGYLFVFLGYYMGKTHDVPARRLGWAILLLGMVIQTLEAYFILKTGLGPFAPHLFLTGTIFLGLGAFIIALNMKEFPGSEIISRLGQIALGMYCVHILFVRVVLIYFDRTVPAEAFQALMIVLTSSISVSFMMSKSRLLKRFVS